MRALFHDLRTRMEAKIENATGVSERIELYFDPQGKLFVREPRYPSLELNMWLDEASMLIRYKYVSKRRKDDEPHQSDTAQFRVAEVGGNRWILTSGERQISLDEAVQLLLEPFG